jgi:hypothetical protein
MLYWIITTILTSLDDILWKKSLNLNRMSSFNFSIIGYSWDFITTFIIIIFWYLNFSILNIYLILTIFGLVILTIFSMILDKKIYEKEKISNLIPYENLDKIFVIIISFFLFSNVWLLSLIITLITILLIITFSIDFKKLSFPKNYKLIIIC